MGFSFRVTSPSGQHAAKEPSSAASLKDLVNVDVAAGSLKTELSGTHLYSFRVSAY